MFRVPKQPRKGLLRDVAIMRDTVWHLSDELAGVSAPQNDFEQLSAEVRVLGLMLRNQIMWSEQEYRAWGLNS